MKPVRVRFAPSPTGELHVGGLRTALFNYLFAKKMGGTFLLRIEDTDQNRYVHEADKRLMDALLWAGLTPDEGPRIGERDLGGGVGPYHQSQRLPLYVAAAEKLMAEGHAYKCYCSAETLDEMRKAQQARGVPTKYDGRCKRLTDADRARLEVGGANPVVRMLIPDKDERIVVRDLIRGNVAFNTSQVDDQVLMKSDGYPTYHLAVVVDDTAMGITHVLRAEEWLSSTPKHILLYKWMGYELPEFAHMPLILNPDRSKMSKRMGDVSVEAFRAKGYLPQALVNFVALLGWSPGDDREIMTLAEMIEAFSIERIGKTGAVFDREKLDWMNQQYLGALSVDELYAAAREFVTPGRFAADEAMIRKMLAIVQPGLVTLLDVEKNLEMFFKADDAALEDEALEKLRWPEGKQVFAQFIQLAQARAELDPTIFSELMKQTQKDTGVKGKLLWEPMRVALTRSLSGPELTQVVSVLGREKILRRVELALKA